MKPQPISYWRNRRSFYYGSDIQIDKRIIDDVHRLVNEHRFNCGLEPIEFKDRIGDKMSEQLTNGKLVEENTIEVYSEQEIREAYASGGSIRLRLKAGDPKVMCGCKCGSAVPATSAMQGWKFIRGHKPQNLVKKNGHLKNGSADPKSVSNSEVYDSYISRIKMDIANVEGEMKLVQEEANKLTIKLRSLKEKHEKLKAAENALSVLAKPQEKSIGAFA